jgi:3-methyladenine DNA glycosylase/8-oxoguanine DNA glycosylase
MFRLGRPDILRPTISALMNAVHPRYGLRKTSRRQESSGRSAKRGGPYRSIASWYLWQSLNKT